MKVQMLLEAALFGVLASGMAFHAPEATAVVGLGNAAELLPHPMQTMAPDIGQAELFKRDYELTVLVGPDNTCGYFSGLAASSYYCGGVGYTCDLILSLYTSAGAPVGGIACCNTASCVARTTCINSAQYAAGARCTSFCVACTDATRPYCGGVTMSKLNVRDLFCDTTTTNAFQVIDTTYPNQLAMNHIFKTTSFLVTDSTGTTAAASSNAGGAVTVTATPQTVTAFGSVGGSAAPAASNSASVNPQQDNSSGPPIGPIVGGVVGGVAVLAGIGAAIFFIMRKKRRAAQNAQQPPPPFNPQQNQMPPMGQYPQGPVGPAVGGAAAGAAWGYGHQQINEAPGSPPEKPGYYVPPMHEAPGSTVAPAASPNSGYGSPPQGYAPPYDPNPAPYNYNPNAAPHNYNQNLAAYNRNSDVISPHSQGSPASLPPAQLSGSNVYPHHDTVHEIGG